MPFLPNILTARLVEHVEEHGGSIVKPDLTGLSISLGYYSTINSTNTVQLTKQHSTNINNNTV